MSNLAQLQKRLAAAFGPAAASHVSSTHEDAAISSAFARYDEVHAAEADPVTPAVAEGDGDGVARLWLGGGGMLVAAFILAMGLGTGFYTLCGALGAVLFGSALIYVLQRPSPVIVPWAEKPAAAAATKRQEEIWQDQRWEQDENVGLLGAIHDALGDIAVVRDMSRRIIYANDTFRALTGCAVPEGRSCEEIGLAFRPEAEPYRFDVEIATPFGQRIFVWHDVIARDASTGQLKIRSIARDVTEERQASKTREAARIKAENTSAAKSRLLATVSHEIRTPLSGILGMGHLLGQTKLTAEQANYLNGIRESGQALSQLVQDLLDFSTIEVGRFHLHPRAESVRHLIEGVVEMLSHRAHEKEIEIASAVSPDIPDVLNFDPARLRQVLFNVIGNAVKFTHAGGVLVTAALDGRHLVITVEDTGAGMTAEEQARIFGEFEQAGNASDKSAGTGLGLSISARIMREFGGSLSAVSEKGRGSTFSIRLPHQLKGENRNRSIRESELRGNAVLVMAPTGPASRAIVTTVEALGGRVVLASGLAATEEALLQAEQSGAPFTDVIVDHRLATVFYDHVSGRADVARLRSIFLVNPEERNSQPQGVFDAWLIRPLRERSLVDVLRGRMRGMEKRDALNDNQPGFGLPVVQKPAPGLSILLAEDDPINAMLVRATLEKGGHTVRLVQDFPSLLEAVGEAEFPDLIITDLNMPGGDGMEALARIRAAERQQGHGAVPVIVLSADGREEVRRLALLNGANRMFTKPIDPVRLLDEVQALGPMRTVWTEAK
ncbi:hybrid sensor histidine kinase/response regulator [Metarhizobium album]|uniref:histidine kinase n=1 Tax=Metarhizobium album TaxID=2182425 RepID=A0A2U2DS36_9HYPH|nr:ATP-binding protein [Rhizobium album]PWE56029.1 hybrid sensor histidine kinase/response regulator [Rhizobium album]